MSRLLYRGPLFGGSIIRGFTVYDRQVKGATAIKSGRVTVCLEDNDGRSQRKRALMQNNKSGLPGLNK